MIRVQLPDIWILQWNTSISRVAVHVQSSPYQNGATSYISPEGKAIPVTGRGGLEGCETSRLPYFLENRLTDGSEVVSLTRRSLFTPRKIPDTHFC
jgi:hypothetical protein